MEKIFKRFGKIQALRDVDFHINQGEVVGLLGDNGAGKSTLIKILSGFIYADSGAVYIDNKKIILDSPKDAIEKGIETIYQNLALIDDMSITRNIFLGRELTKYFSILDKYSMRNRSLKILQELGLGISNPDIKVRYLSGGERQGVAIARAIHFKARILLMDEPTTALSVRETKKILELLLRFKSRGVSSVFVTHNLYHVYPVADRFVILSHGRKVLDIKKEKTSIKRLEKAIIN
jgi:simple sugar transport system ATP-binding protein